MNKITLNSSYSLGEAVHRHGFIKKVKIEKESVVPGEEVDEEIPVKKVKIENELVVPGEEVINTNTPSYASDHPKWVATELVPNWVIKNEKEMIVPGDEIVEGSSLKKVKFEEEEEESVFVNPTKEQNGVGKTEEEKKEAKEWKIVELFEKLNGWNILAPTDNLDVLKSDEFNNIDLDIPYLLLPTSADSNIHKEYIDKSTDEDFKKFSNVKEFLDFVVDWYFSNPFILRSLFMQEAQDLLVAYLCERAIHGVNDPAVFKGSIEFYTENAKTIFGGVYFTSNGGMVVKLLFHHQK
jgi:hypothetical protein